MLQIHRHTSGIFRGYRARARNRQRPFGTTMALLFARREGKRKFPCVATFSRRLVEDFEPLRQALPVLSFTASSLIRFDFPWFSHGNGLHL